MKNIYEAVGGGMMLTVPEDFDRDAKTEICIPLIPTRVDAPIIEQVFLCVVK